MKLGGYSTIYDGNDFLPLNEANNFIQFSSFLRPQFITPNINNTHWLILPSYNLSSPQKIDNCYKILDENSGLDVILDFTAERVSKNVIPFLEKCTNPERVKIYGNVSHNNIDFSKFIKKGGNVSILPYFIKYVNYYTPLKQSKPIKKKFLFQLGKLKPERLALLGLLSYEGLLKYGHISFIRKKNELSNIDDSYLESLDFSTNDLRKVRKGLDKIKNDLVLDTDKFDYITSHNRIYNSSYYHSSDFVIVCESDPIPPNHFYTEKIGKCIQLNKKFILLGSQGMAKDFINQCNTFLKIDTSSLVNWCDLSYDQLPSVSDRILSIVDEIKKQIQYN